MPYFCPIKSYRQKTTTCYDKVALLLSTYSNFEIAVANNSWSISILVQPTLIHLHHLNHAVRTKIEGDKNNFLAKDCNEANF